MNKAIVILGAPGSGKSTIGRIVAENLGIGYVSTGDVARKLIEKGGDSMWMTLGALAPEEELRQAFLDELQDSPFEDFVIDGMPRTPDQVAFLVDQFQEIQFYRLWVSHDELIKRTMERGREDDKYPIIKNRINKYNRTVLRIIDRIGEELDRTDKRISIESAQADQSSDIAALIVRRAW